MSEQKYYVKLRQEVFISDQCSHGGTICHTWLSEDYYFSEELFRQAFTKSELAEIMDGALFKQSDYLPFQWLYSFGQLRDEFGWKYNETIDKWEWINPLIELVPIYEV